jgi:hypothetical protein
MEIGETVTLGSVTGKIIEIVELNDSKRIKLEVSEDKVAVVTLKKPTLEALNNMRLG